jgi:hypothetical protein
MNLAWHFVRLANGTPVLRDGFTPVPPVGKWLEVQGPLVMCRRGLHASWRALDALRFVSWANAGACLVEVEGVGQEYIDKFVCSRRRVLGWAPCDDLLRVFARESALSVSAEWEMPTIVRQYLETGDDVLRETARVSAADAAFSLLGAAKDAAMSAVWASSNPAVQATVAAERSAFHASLVTSSISPVVAYDNLSMVLESILLGGGVA